MRAGLVRQALRRHRWAFLGPFATQSLAAAVITAMLTSAWSLSAAQLTAQQRHALDDSDLPAATAVFTGNAIYLSILMVGVTMSAAITRQARDIALLRAVGATPGQIRRSVAGQAALIAVPAAVFGYVLGLAGGWLWLAALVDHGLVPDAVGFRPDPVVLPIVVGIEVATSTVGALVAAVRPARIAPAIALTETATRRPAGGRVRTMIGVVLLVGGVILSGVVSGFAADQADDAAFFVILAMCVGCGLLGPVLLVVAVRLARPLLRLAGGVGVLAADALVARSRAASSAQIPLVLAGSFAAVKVTAHTTAEHVTGVREPAADLWLDYSGTAIFVAFAVIGALNTLLTVSVGRRHELALLRLAGASRARLLAGWTCEAGIVLGTVFVAATGVALATLVPLTHTALDTSLPHVPPSHIALGLFGGAAVVATGTVVPAAVLTHRPAIETVRAATA
jgi:putative ABC transport system permease protein